MHATVQVDAHHGLFVRERFGKRLGAVDADLTVFCRSARTEKIIIQAPPLALKIDD